MEEMPNYFAVLPANVRYDKELKDKAKLLYAEIVALSNKNGYCYASNQYFANLYGVTPTTISMLIKELVDKGYITREIVYHKNTKEIKARYLKIFEGGIQKNLNTYLKNFKGGIQKNLKENNTRINNINKNNIYSEQKITNIKYFSGDDQYNDIEKYYSNYW